MALMVICIILYLPSVVEVLAQAGRATAHRVRPHVPRLYIKNSRSLQYVSLHMSINNALLRCVDWLIVGTERYITSDLLIVYVNEDMY